MTQNDKSFWFWLSVVFGCIIIFLFMAWKTALAYPVEDYMGDIQEQVAGSFSGANGETIANSTDGYLCLTGVGGTYNEDACFRLDQNNVIYLTTNTGVTLWDWGTIDIATDALDLDGDMNLTGGGTITSSSAGDITLNPNTFGNVIFVSDTGSSVMLGPVALVGSGVNFTSAGTAVLTKATHGISGIAAGQVLQITDATTSADEGFYIVASSDANTITLTETLGGSDADVDIQIYSGVYELFARRILNNSESPTPTPVAANQTWMVPPYNASTENTAVYCKLDHRSTSTTDNINCLYLENDGDQSQTGGSAIKVVHRGNGDAVYVAIIGDSLAGGSGSGYGYEAAMFGGEQVHGSGVPKQENGFLGSFQGSGGFQESYKIQSNSIPFHALVHDDGTDPTTPTPWATNYGLFYANNSLANAFVARVSAYALNYPQFKIMDATINQRQAWAAYADGSMYMDGAEATVGSPQKTSPEFKLRGKYFDTGVEYSTNTVLKTVVNGSNIPLLYIYTGLEGAETLRLTLSSAGMSLQNHNLTDVNGITMYSSGTGIDMQTKGITNTGTITGVSSETIDNATASTWKFASSGGTNNEDLTLNFETNANQITLGSTTGVTDINFGLMNIRGAPSILRGTQTSDAAALTLAVHAGAAYPLASSNVNGGTLKLGGGPATRSITISTAANCGTRNVVMRVDGTSTTKTEGTHWTKTDGDNDATAASLASALNGISGMTATSTGAVVNLTPSDSTIEMDILSNTIVAASCGSIAEGVDGTVMIATGGKLLLSQDSSGYVNLYQTDGSTYQALKTGSVISNGGLTAGATNYHAWTGRGYIGSPAAFVFTLTDSNAAAGVRLNASTDGTLQLQNYAGTAYAGLITGATQLDAVGSSVNSPILTLSGDNAGTQEDGTIQLMYGASPYLRISVTDDGTTPVTTAVLDIHDTIIANTVAAQTSFGDLTNHANYFDTYYGKALALTDITNISNHLTLTWGEDDSADRTLQLKVSGGNRILTIEADSIVNQDLSSDSTTAQFGTLTLNNTGLHVLDTNASHDLILTPGSDLTADHTLTLTTGDADRTLSIEADSVINQDLSSDSATAQFATLTATATILGTGASIGWTVVSGADTACTTTCTTPACVFGWDAGTTSPVACDSALADVCICAGTNP